jgi:hypothetical protein
MGLEFGFRDGIKEAGKLGSWEAELSALSFGLFFSGFDL